MSEILVWTMYLIGAAAAFALVRYRGWPLTLSILTPSVVGTLIYYLVVEEIGKEANEPFWLRMDLALNFSFFLIFAGAGAAIGMFIRERTVRGTGDAELVD
ncbi:hypothetical protein G7077_05325 [Sphingomonas piscis]|uniref:Uncharacterized protein n=1 Tax=Sphingomonas piscis TaxID=2714943 RepID=A0A6G7YNU3_9SPHN|nr:hypothetical protein [Sphingomonas piscis]QIK78413.1 hypothetical protein G7077_05325 [Sphingomonas piscis]